MTTHNQHDTNITITDNYGDKIEISIDGPKGVEIFPLTECESFLLSGQHLSIMKNIVKKLEDDIEKGVK